MKAESVSPPLPSSCDAIDVPIGKNESYYFQSWKQGFRCWKPLADGKGLRAVVFPYRIIDEHDPDRISPDLEALFTISHGLSITESNPSHYCIGDDAEKLGRLDEGLPEKLQPFQQLLLEIPPFQRLIASQCGKRHYLDRIAD